MKLNSKFAFLALALTGGMASAAVPLAGTSLTNVATADFVVKDPNGDVTGQSQSNQVTTKITPVASFTVTPNTNDAALKHTAPANTTTTFTYTIINTGNTPVKVDLTSGNTSNTAPTAITLSKSSVTLQPNESTTVDQTYKVGNPATYGQNLIGTGYYDPNPSSTGAATNYTSAIDKVDNDNENVTTVASATTATPGSPATGPTDFPLDPNNPNITPNPNPTPTAPGTGTGYVEPAGPTVPGGATLPGAGTPVDVALNGSQTAYPKADPDKTEPDTVSMTGTAPNNSGVNDNITVGPATDPDGTGPITATIINPKTGQPFTNTDVPVDINGSPIPGASVVVNGDGSVTFKDVPTGTAPAYTIQVKYPDTEGPNSPTSPIVVTVPITSGNAGGQAIATPTYTVKTPGVDLVVVAQDSATALDASGQNITPSTTATTNADFASSVKNTGTYSDTFNITSGTNDLPSGATVEYWNADKSAKLTDTNGDGTVDVGEVQPGATVNFTTRVILPANAPARNDYAVRDIATGAYSTTNDTDGTLFNVGVVQNPDSSNVQNPLFPITKSVDKANAAPGDTLIYTIGATNKYNVATCNTILKEIDGSNTNIFANSTYQSITGTSSAGTVLFSTNQGGNWGAAPAAGVLSSLWAGVDVNGDNTISAADCLPSNGTINLTLTTKVNGSK